MKIIKWNGKPITKPGVYSGIPIERYHSGDICDGPSVSSTDLRKCWFKSPKHFFDQWPGNPDSVRDPPTKQMSFGSVVHYLTLGESGFWKRYVQRPDTYRDLKTAEEKKWHASATPCVKWVESQTKSGFQIVTKDELQRVIGIAKELALEPLVMDGAMSGAIETSMFAKDSETGIWIKTRPDIIPTNGGDYSDLKTAAEVTTVALQSAIRSRGYHMQGGLIWEACDQLGLPFVSFLLIFVESDRPFCVYPVPVADDDLARGRMQCRSSLRKIARGIETGVWQSTFDGNLRPLGISLDERARIDSRLKDEGIG